jgi:hypothetical protein
MCFPVDHPDPNLRGEPKGIRTVLQERKSVWDKLTTICRERGKKVVGKCAACMKSDLRKDKEWRIAIAEATGEGEVQSMEDIASEMPSNAAGEWCCMYKVLSLQEDFWSEKPLIQSIIEDAGHICLFLPRFHCELNVIEMLWGYGKYRAHISLMCLACSVLILDLRAGYRNMADGRFATAKTLVPQCLDSCNLTTIRRFFQKSWRFMDSYRKGLDAQQAAFANKKYKSHQRIGLLSDILASLATQDVQ